MWRVSINNLSKLHDYESFVDSELCRPRHTSPLTSNAIMVIKQWSDLILKMAYKEGKYPLSENTVSQGIRLALNPVFIGGVHRSGTTLLATMLDEHPQLLVLPGEALFFSGVYPKIKSKTDRQKINIILYESLLRFINPSGQEPYWLLGRTSNLNSPYIEYARMLLSWWEITRKRFPNNKMQPLVASALAYSSFKRNGNIPKSLRYWVEKSPLNELYQDDIFHCFSTSRLIQLVRNPFDVYASRKKMELLVRGEFYSKSRCITDLRLSYKIAACSPAKSLRNLLVTYEELVGDRNKSLETIINFIGIDFDPALNKQTISGLPSYANSSFILDKEIDQAISIPVDRSLSSKEYRQVAALTGKYSRKLGYSIPDTTPFQYLWIGMQMFFDKLRRISFFTIRNNR